MIRYPVALPAASPDHREQTPTGTQPRHPGIGRVVASLSLLMSLTTGSVLGAGPLDSGSFGADAASAATPSGEVVFCFKHTNGRPYLYDITAQVEIGGTLRPRETRRSVDGCFEWSVQSGYRWRFHAHASVGRVSWTGSTNAVLVRGGIRHHAGVYLVAEESH
jgi:hypothetical protein